MRHARLVMLVGWAAVIFLFSSFPNPPGATGREWRYDAAHIGEYFVFGALAVNALRFYLQRWPIGAVALAAWALSALYGMSDEFHQSFVPNRDANWLDVRFDATGAALGVAVMATVARRRALQQRRTVPRA